MYQHLKSGFNVTSFVKSSKRSGLFLLYFQKGRQKSYPRAKVIMSEICNLKISAWKCAKYLDRAIYNIFEMKIGLSNEISISEVHVTILQEVDFTIYFISSWCVKVSYIQNNWCNNEIVGFSINILWILNFHIWFLCVIQCTWIWTENC